MCPGYDIKLYFIVKLLSSSFGNVEYHFINFPRGSDLFLLGLPSMGQIELFNLLLEIIINDK